MTGKRVIVLEAPPLVAAAVTMVVIGVLFWSAYAIGALVYHDRRLGLCDVLVIAPGEWTITRYEPHSRRVGPHWWLDNGRGRVGPFATVDDAWDEYERRRDAGESEATDGRVRKPLH